MKLGNNKTTYKTNDNPGQRHRVGNNPVFQVHQGGYNERAHKIKIENPMQRFFLQRNYEQKNHRG